MINMTPQEKELLEELFFAEDVTCVKQQYNITLYKTFILTFWPDCLVPYKRCPRTQADIGNTPHPLAEEVEADG
jgi:hypothetical protein